MGNKTETLLEEKAREVSFLSATLGRCYRNNSAVLSLRTVCSAEEFGSSPVCLRRSAQPRGLNEALPLSPRAGRV